MNKRMPNFDYIRRELQRKGVNIKLLWVEYCEECRQCGEEPLLYSQFCYYIQKDEESNTMIGRCVLHQKNRENEDRIKADINDMDNSSKRKPSVFVSYNWDSSNKLAEELQNKLTPFADVKRDKKSVKAWGDLTEFMNSIRDQDFAVLIISDAYLKSEACLYEVMELMKASDWDERVMYVVTDDAHGIYDTTAQLEYIGFWRNKKQRLSEEIQKFNPAAVTAQAEALKKIELISLNIGTFMAKVKGTNNPKLKKAIGAVIERVGGKDSSDETVLIHATYENMNGVLWEERIPVDKRFQIYLQDYNNWESIDGGQSFYYKLFPEFVIETERDKDRNGYEYYCFSQIKHKPSWYNIRLKCNGTVIEDTLGISLDGGRFFTAVPNCIFNVASDFFYGYIERTLQYELSLMLLRRMERTYYDSVLRWNECMPVFESEEEKKEFLEYLKGTEIKMPVEKYHLCVPDRLENGECGALYKLQYPKSIGIVNMLWEFRNSKE